MRRPLNNIMFTVICLNPVEYWTGVEKGCVYPVVGIEPDGRYLLMNRTGKYVKCSTNNFLSLERSN
jgi:hypothetical protein